jgi:hypothetical protein
MLNRVTTWRRIQRIRKCLLSNHLSPDCSYAFVERRQHRKFSLRVAPRSDAIYRIVKQSEETATVCDKRANGRKRSACVPK